MDLDLSHLVGVGGLGSGRDLGLGGGLGLGRPTPLRGNLSGVGFAPLAVAVLGTASGAAFMVSALVFRLHVGVLDSFF